MTVREAATTAQLGELVEAVGHGAAWGYASFALSKLLVFATITILARLLLPEQFGVVGYALAISGYLELAHDLGVGSALIARTEIDRPTASTAFFLSVAWGLLLTAVVFLGAPALGAFFGDARAVPVARALSPGFFLAALGSTHAALLYRGLAFGRRVVPDVVQVATRGVVSVALALGGWGYWSLVVGQLAGQLSFCLCAWALHPFRPGLDWDRGAARWLLGFGTAVVASRLVVGLTSTSAFLIAGSELGAAALGLFTLGYRVPEVALLSSFTILSSVLFPFYARLQHDEGGLRRGYLLAQRYVALIVVPLGAGVVLISPLFVSVFYGARWLDSAPVMQLLAARCALSVVGWGAGDVAKATGRARLQVVLNVVPAAVVIPAMIVAARSSGLLGLAAAYAAGTFVSGLVRVILARAVVRTSTGRVLLEIWPGVIAAVMVAIGAEAFLVLSHGWPGSLRLVGAVLSGAGAYSVALWLVGRDLLGRLPDLLPLARPRSRMTAAGGGSWRVP